MAQPPPPEPVVAYVAVHAAKLLHLYEPRLREMRAQGFRVVAFTAAGPGVARLTELGVEHIPVPVEASWDPARQAVAWLLMTSALIERRALLVHSQAASLHLTAALAARAASVPLVAVTVHTHGGGGGGLGDAARDAWFRAVARLVDLYVVRHEAERAIAARFVPAERLELVEADVGVDVRAFNPALPTLADPAALRVRFGLEGAERWVGTVGRLGLPEVEPLLAVIDRVQRDDPGLGWALGSCAPMDPALLAGIAARRAAGRALVALDERVPAELPALYRALDLVALPWTGYGAGLSAMEAAAMRLPAVAFERSDTRDVVVEGQTGALIAPGDGRAFAEAVLGIGRSERRRRDLGAAARARAEERFDFEFGQAQLFARYDALIQERVP